MTEVTLDVPDDMPVALKLTPERFGDEVRLAAARLAGLPVPVFLGRLADYRVTASHLNEAEIREDAQRA